MATIEVYTLKGTGTKAGPKRYRVRYRTPDKRSTDKGGFKTKADAQAFAATVETAKLNGTFVSQSAGRVTVGTLFDQWLSGSVRIKATTRAARQSAWDARVSAKWAAVAAGDVKVSAVKSWVAEMNAAGVGAASIEAAVLVLRGCLDVAVDDRALTINPAAKIKVPRRVQHRRGYLTAAQVQALASEMARDNDATVVRFLALTGLRWGEMAALRVSSFDMLRRRVQISEAVAEVRGALVWGTPKTKKAIRSVAWPSVLADELADLMRTADGPKGRNDFVFTGPDGGCFRVSCFRPRVFAAAVKRCQAVDPTFPTITPHDLRHTAASLAIRAGANVKAVQNMLGHESAALTLDTYSDLFPDDLDDVADRMDAEFRGSVEQGVGVPWVRAAQ